MRETYSDTEISKEQFELLFNELPASFIILKADPPKFTILKASDQLIKSSLQSRENVIGKGVFEAFISNKSDQQSSQQEKDVSDSFYRVVRNKKEDSIPIQRYDLLDPKTGNYVKKYWSVLTKPVFDEDGEVNLIIHYTQDITELIRLRESEKMARQDLILQQKRLFDFFIQAPVAIAILIGPKFKVELANPSFCKIINRSHHEIINQPFFKVLDELKSFDFKELLSKVMETGKRYTGLEHPAQILSNGKMENYFFNFVYEPVKEENNSITGVFVVATDVTEQVQLKRRIEENEQRLKFCLEAAQLGIWEIEPETEKNIRNLRHDQIFGYKETVEEWNFEIFFSHLHPEDKDYVIEAFKEPKSGEQISIETRIITTEGSIKWIEVKGNPFIDKNSKKKIFGVIADITERKQLELQKDEYMILLKEYNEELEEVALAKDKFISVISHDLRNPLSVIASSSEIILNDFQNMERSNIEKFIKVILKSSKRVVKQLNELVEWSKAKGRKIAFSPIDKSLYECVNIALQMLESAAIQKNITIKNKCPEDIEIFADPLMMQSILQNLVSNSIKFSPEGGFIEIVGRVKEKEKVEIMVIDSGIGMPEEVRKKIFKKSTIITTKGTMEEKGSGLGLKLVKEFVEKQGGEILVKSEAGKGSCFLFTVPQSKGNITSSIVKKD